MDELFPAFLSHQRVVMMTKPPQFMKPKQYIIHVRMLLALLLVPSLMSAIATPVQTNHSVIPFSQIGAVAREHYTGNGLSITKNADGAILRCVFQKLEGRANSEGLWLVSTEGQTKGVPFRVFAQSVGRDDGATLPLAETGQVVDLAGMARFNRQGLDEEYTVSVDGVRQDFVVTSRPGGQGGLRVNLEVDGASASPSTDGAQLVLDGSGRRLAYHRLKAVDAAGRTLEAHMIIVSPSHLEVVVDDNGAVYPVRIDPTFSDADWGSLGISGLPGTSGQIEAVAIDTNGNVYVGGEFTIIGTAVANNIVRWNGAAWSPLGAGMNGQVEALVLDGEGNLYAGGSFTEAGGINANGIAKWNGTNWSALGTGMTSIVLNNIRVGQVFSLTLDNSGNLFAGGGFNQAGGVNATNIAKWNGSSWSALGTGISGQVGNLIFDSSSNLYVASLTNEITSWGTIISKWNGITWQALGLLTPVDGNGSGISSLALDDTSGTLYVSGYFTSAGGLNITNLARWSGGTWSAFGSVMLDVNAYAFGLKLAFDNTSRTLYLGGPFYSVNGISANGFAKWNGSTWSALSPGLVTPTVLALDQSGILYAAGPWVTDENFAGVAEWNGSVWNALGANYSQGMTNDVNAVACDNSGNLYVESGPENLTGTVYEWNGFAWTELGSMDSPVYALACDNAGNLYAGGAFANANGTLAYNIAMWNGSSWSPLGSGILGEGGEVNALACDKSGNLYAGGSFSLAGGQNAYNIAMWNGSSWSPLGSGIGGEVYSLACDANGNVYAGGFFESAGGVDATNVAEWNGTAWSGLGPGLIDGGGYALACDTDGNLYAGGDFGTTGGISGIAKWNGTNWSELGSGMNGLVLSLVCDSSGNVYAGGLFTTAGGIAANGIAEWNGSTWSALGSGVGGGDGGYYGDGGYTVGSPSVNALALDGFGSLYAGGDFYTAGTNVAYYVAQALLTGASTRPPPGSLQVTIAPSGAVTAGSQWQVDGGAFQNSGTTVSNLSVGPHMITFNTISSWTTPPFQRVTVDSGAKSVASGTYIQFTYVVTNGTITITGYTGSGGAVTIPGEIYGLPVTDIADQAFDENYSITSLVIGMNVTNIGVNSFASCDSLTNVVFPNTLTSIEEAAFYGCVGLTSITIPGSVATIGDYAFGSTSLAHVYFLGNAPSVDSTVFDFDYSTPTIYYLPGTTGWSQFLTTVGLHGFLWNPSVQTANGSLGTQNGRFGFNITGTTNIPIAVVASTNLNDGTWTSLFTGILTNGSFYFSDSHWTNYSQRFYRISGP
jgi:BspA type Leucine rich repeat region (6 copies)